MDKIILKLHLTISFNNFFYNLDKIIYKIHCWKGLTALIDFIFTICWLVFCCASSDIFLCRFDDYRVWQNLCWLDVE